MNKKIAFLGMCSMVVMCMVSTGAYARTKLGTITVPAGQPGKNAYEMWKETHENGSLEDFWAFFKGKDGTSINIKGTVSTCTALNGLTGVVAGDIYLVEEDNYNGYVYNGTNFPTCPGGGIAIKGPKGDPGTPGSKGDKGENGTNGTNGTNGSDGKSAYDLWKEAGNTGTQAQFLASLKGEKGDKGENGTNGTNGSDGKSAYDLWKEAGNTGTQAQFLASLKGEKGDKGENGTNGTNGTNGSDGKSAYDLWKEAGNTGTQTQFLASLKGEKGDKGENGTNGTNGSDGKDFDPCEGNENSTTIVRSTSSSGYTRGTKSNGVYSQIGGRTVTKTLCSGTQTSYEQDTCIEIAKDGDKCTGDSNAYLQCTNPSLAQNDDPVYYVCQSLGSGNESLAEKVKQAQNTANSKASQSDLTALSNTVAGKASQSDLTALSNTVAGKASASDLSALQTEIAKKASQSDLTALSNTVAGKADATALEGVVKTDGNGRISAGVLPPTVIQTSDLGECNIVTTGNKSETVCTQGSIMATIYNNLKDTIEAGARNQ